MIVWRANPLGVDRAFREDVEQLLQPSPHTWYILSGARSLTEQAALWAAYQAGGPRAAPPGQSAHNFGLAVDVVADIEPAPGLQPSWDIRKPAWIWLAAAVDAHPRLHHGRHFGDWPHIERVNWKIALTHGGIT